MKMSNTILNICGKPYLFHPKLTLSTLEVIIEGGIPEEGDIGYRGRIAAAIKKSITTDKGSAPILDQIVSSDDSVFKTYIDAVLNENNYLIPFYNERNEQEEQCERFCKACEDYMCELSQSLSEKIKEVTIPLTELTQRSRLIFSDFQRQVATLHFALAPALTYISKISESLSQSMKGFSEINFDAWKQSYECWGCYGWAVIDDVPFRFYTHPPKNQIDADIKALKYFKKDNIITLWSDIESLPFSRQEIDDINEAISCFNAKNYKACSMLVCALIDGVCIKNQSSDGNLNVGAGAIKNIKNKFKKTPYGSSMGFIFFYSTNLLRCLFTYFDLANNFKNEPPRYNRNFVHHGMSKRKVLRKDCIKLFLILHNLMQLIEWCNEKNPD